MDLKMRKLTGGKKLRLGECPVWDVKRKVLYYVDIEVCLQRQTLGGAVREVQ